MLEKVRQATLVVVLEYGPRIDDEPDLRPLFGLGIPPNHVAETVIQLSGADSRVNRQWLVEIGLLGDSGNAYQAGDDGGREQRTYRHLNSDSLVLGRDGTRETWNLEIWGQLATASNRRTIHGSITIVTCEITLWSSHSPPS
jgi:hypothetical protein